MRETEHKLCQGDARDLVHHVEPQSASLVLTSPPYPMISMWDESWRNWNAELGDLMDRESDLAWEAIHGELDDVWAATHALLKPGGWLVINIGDAVRSFGGMYRLYANHARIIQSVQGCGFIQFPGIIWRKAANSPNKFLGSGMLPAGAYLTLEHEHILVFRKGAAREFHGKERLLRRESAIFWEERNQWYSDLWTLPGLRQTRSATRGRGRSGAFPIEIATRLIQMFSLKEDVVIDPFMGTGTTNIAAMSCERSSIGFEVDNDLFNEARDRFTLSASLATAKSYAENRLGLHNQFVESELQKNKTFRHFNEIHNTPVRTAQETDLTVGCVYTIELKESFVESALIAAQSTALPGQTNA